MSKILLLFVMLCMGNIVYSQRVDTVKDLSKYQSYIDTSYNYIKYFLQYPNNELEKISLGLPDKQDYLISDKDEITSIIKEYGFPNKSNLLLTSTILYIYKGNNRTTSENIDVQFIFPKADINEKNDSTSISFLYSESPIPISVGFWHYERDELAAKRFMEEMMKSMDSTKVGDSPKALSK